MTTALAITLTVFTLTVARKKVMNARK